MEFIYRVFTRMPGESYSALCCCVVFVFQALINSLVS